jgi:hypothetical protein
MERCRNAVDGQDLSVGQRAFMFEVLMIDKRIGLYRTLVASVFVRAGSTSTLLRRNGSGSCGKRNVRREQSCAISPTARTR